MKWVKLAIDMMVNDLVIYLICESKKLRIYVWGDLLPKNNIFDLGTMYFFSNIS